MSSVAAVLPHLKRRFENHRIVFWHDPDGQYTDDLETLNLPDVQTIRVTNDEYGIKHRLLHVEPTAKFLVYRSGPCPTGIGNWLLDLELAYGTFTANRASLVAQDLGLTAEGINDAVRDHEKFFNATKRIQSLTVLLSPDDDATDLCAKMSAVVLGQRENSFLEITRTLLIENAEDQRAKYDALVEFGLDEFYWRGAASIYGYESASPSVYDLVLWIFRQAMEGFESDRPGGLRNIQLDFASLRNDRRSQKALTALAKRTARNRNYASSIEDTNFRDLVDVDIFEETDLKITSDLARAVAEQTITAHDVAEIVRARQNTVWIDDYKQRYTAIASASELLTKLTTVDFTMSSFDNGLERYCREWFRIDQLYRQFVFAYRAAEHQQSLEPLREQVEKRYVNTFVYELGSAWQQQVDSVDSWSSSALQPQTSFYTNYVGPILRDNKKAVVIISDALRYEVADELRTRIRQEDRFDASLDAVLGVLPSHTKLGMAALLPHRTLTYSADLSTALVDGQPTNSTALRGKVLTTVGGSAIGAEDYKGRSGDERRELFRNNRVLFIYHDRIDATGDKLSTERQVFEAVAATLRDIVDLVKKAASANATNIFVTADHGFLFQNHDLADAFFLSTKPEGDDIKATNKRYVLGHGLKTDPAFTMFTSAQLGLDGDLEAQVPKSIHRLRLAGGGSRYVHGGAALQEIVVPVLTVTKKRKSDTRQVDVEIRPESDKITTGQVVVRLRQAESVSDKVQPRTLRAGLYVGEALISNQIKMTFDQQSTDKRDRDQNARMLLSADADAYHNREVEFRLEEQIPNTSQWRTYRKTTYTLKRSFASDFDF
ncbi:BREX-1 system phosphatase PglZ type A [Mycobacterium sp. 155]|uniref:BREX-1 system phosphatase PglZ type A n=1 Tax=Mycobacterium sp. 155 TaxID=1157943 RepID=UPI00036170E7|nr:BREX-1 system phosphatase PglZ type A [Mycobacterium sp. 155]